MATTAEELRREIEEYLDVRIRCKPKDDRTKREEFLLETLQRSSEELLAQGTTKRNQQRAALESLLGDASDTRLAELLRISTEKRRIERMLDEEGGE